MSKLALAAIAIVLSLALAATEAAQVWATYDGARPSPFLSIWLNILPAWILVAALAPAVMIAIKRWRLDFRARSIAVHAAGSLAFAVVHALVLAVFKQLRGWPAHPFATLVKSNIYYNFVADLGIYWLIAGAVQILDNLRTLREREASLAQARLDALRAQLNPHFLYNVLNTAAMLAREQRSEETVAVLARLGELLRYVLRQAPAGDAPLSEELDFLRGYLELERVRFADRLEVGFDVDPALSPLRLPSLLLQPLVENAIRHGISRKPGAGRIFIRAHRRGPEVELEVRDDGPGVGSLEALGVGIRNTRDRLAQRYGPSARLTVSPLPHGGTAAIVTLPWEERAP